MTGNIQAIAEDLARCRHVVAFTGAGISAESGIPTFRGRDGIWNRYDPSLYASIHGFRRDPSLYWRFFQEVRYPLLKKARPNRAHLALAEIEETGNLKAVITQNIDGLHQEAGSSVVIELHGTSRIIRCTGCPARFPMEAAHAMLETQLPPLCPKCGGVLRPAVVFFGESLDPQTLEAAWDHADACDFLLAVGSSLAVYPAADIPLRAKRRGAGLGIINAEDTPLDDTADHLIHGEAGRILPRLSRAIRQRSSGPYGG